METKKLKKDETNDEKEIKKQKIETEIKINYLNGMYTKMGTNEWNLGIEKTIDDLNLRMDRTEICKPDFAFTGDLKLFFDFYKDIDFKDIKNDDIDKCTKNTFRQILAMIMDINTAQKRVEPSVDQFVSYVINLVLESIVSVNSYAILLPKRRLNIRFNSHKNVVSIPDYIIKNKKGYYCCVVEDKDKKYEVFGQAIGEIISAIQFNIGEEINIKSFFKPFPFILVSGTDFLFGALNLDEEYYVQFIDEKIPKNPCIIQINGYNDDQYGKYQFNPLDFNRPVHRKIILGYILSYMKIVIDRTF